MEGSAIGSVRGRRLRSPFGQTGRFREVAANLGDRLGDAVTMKTQGEIEAAICEGIGHFEQEHRDRRSVRCPHPGRATLLPPSEIDIGSLCCVRVEDEGRGASQLRFLRPGRPSAHRLDGRLRRCERRPCTSWSKWPCTSASILHGSAAASPQIESRSPRIHDTDVICLRASRCKSRCKLAACPVPVKSGYPFRTTLGGFFGHGVVSLLRWHLLHGISRRGQNVHHPLIIGRAGPLCQGNRKPGYD